ncbi:M23 family metallopeptidase [Intrasporangium calvum]|uniref:M23 family metallopeptidase n=1 Tax=Intrasporangium calvum TaxID=53358 RepID=A0ABT5GI77_9MICO|nr:M23 family metallopeptidase [Intrasporangium calvum]MDC5697924.1 M23 family metallopeptidase [Intrasporangium calvum]
MLPLSDLVAALVGAGLSIGLATGSPPPTPPREPAPPVGSAAPHADPPDGSSRGWRWPLAPQPEVVHPFDPPKHRWEPGHRGVDLRASVGQEVHSPEAGEVAFASRLAGRSVLVVRHTSGLRSTFEPVESLLRVGAQVAKGEIVGRVSGEPTHCDPATCLHWGVLRGREYLDPLALLGRPPVVLLPLG